MAVLKELLEWSNGRPIWQREALRHLIIKGAVSSDDILELTEICKSAQGLVDKLDLNLLTKDHIPDEAVNSEPVSLDSIFHYRGVNALAENQTLKFSNNLTLVYGDNGAGKTGYIRVLKSACRARGQEDILGNVISGKTPLSPEVSIKYKIGTDGEIKEWTGSEEDEYISRVSVFDTQSAGVYLTEKTDVAFRPFGLDLFDKLVKICKAVRTKLEEEKSSLSESKLTSLESIVPEGTAVSKRLSNLSSLTKPEAIQALAYVSPEEHERLNLLEKSLADLNANDPQKLIRQLDLRVGRIQSLVQHLETVELALSEQSVTSFFDTRVQGRRKSEEAKKLREAAFPANILPGTGSETWSGLWEAARHFSDEHAYPSQSYPFVDEGAHCVLCQQRIDSDSSGRLKQFEEFVASTAERELRTLRESFKQKRKDFTDLNTITEAAEEAIKEIRIENQALADAIETAIRINEDRRKAVVHAISENCDLSHDCPPVHCQSAQAHQLAEQIQSRIKTLRTQTTEERKKSMEAEAQELRARKLLAQHESLVLDEIERKKKIAAYGLCIEDTRTQAITQKSTAVTKSVVSQKLKRSFKQELESLCFRHAEVELKEAGGADGLFYHKLVLTRAPGVELPKVVSEGEQRCLSIAAFFAELSTADERSGIVFDDPVSSLDYRWREGVARRLVEEAKKRQVIVFTHDVVFLLLLKQFSQELNVHQLDQHIRHLHMGSGVCAEELPWVAMPVKKKVGFLKQEWQKADKLFRDGHQTSYEKEVHYLYGLLREAWERSLEEVLLSGVVERFRPGVQTQHIGIIADITEQDCRTLYIAMSKCSKWLPGHDQASAARAATPEPQELSGDIQELENWIKSIRDRRK
ncbi:AAA family ATPase [Idiomarina zobellii]|uniref:AAA domain-containing protein n=1 Tax=Idiomarina zobellii TaxID=86103 RepID=A0A837NFU8_9GAMM|nr:AAA family ATPase [Idiomarina zobellii]KPD23331.1 hypothetical protein AFK76_09955 [Idiomarina zobellii]SDG06874.1 AAA domain-containing protein [Idiomarina zobellii]